MTVNNSAVLNVMAKATISGGAGGAGGFGGEAVSFSTGGSLTNSGIISGGAGGFGSLASPAGNGGNGGAAVSFSSGGSLISSGTISGGNGGLGFLGGNDGNGGAGIVGAGLAIVNSGTISGGLGGDGVTLANAISFTGGTNSLTLQSGSTITGNVVAFSTADTLALGGSANASFNVSQIGSSAQYRGFGVFQKTGTSTWTLTGMTTAVTPWTLSGGTLNVSADSSLGAASGGLTFNGGTLLYGAGFSSARGVTLGAGGGTIDTNGNAATLSGTINGSGGLTKIGGGTLALSGNNNYTGGTTISAGTLQAGSATAFSVNSAFNVASVLDLNGFSNTIGSLSGNGTVTNTGSGAATLTVGSDNSNTTFSGILKDGTLAALGLTKTGTGTLILGGANTYSGGIIINNGTLLVNNSQALGLGNVVINGGVLGADPQPINVKGNYTQNAGGTLQLQVAGANPGQYDSLNVGGNATLGGTLQLISLGFQPKAGNQLTLVTTGGVVSSRFAQIIDPFATGPGFNIVDLVYGRNSVLLEFLNIVPPVPSVPPLSPVITTINFASFALTPKELAAANLLDAVQLDPRAASLISFLDKEPFANLPGDFGKISPDGLTAIFEISFSNANIQRLTLESRMDDIHNGSNGFSSNMKLNGATANLENKPGVDGKSSKGVVEPILQPGPRNRWGVWVTGFGDFVNVDGDGNANGYDFTTGGFSLGIDYRITDQLSIGAMGEYSHTWTALQPSGDIDVDSGRGGLYATWFNHGFYLNGAIYGGHNTYESSRSSLGGLATGGTEGAEWSTFISGGYDFHFGHLSVGPIAALQYTYVNINGFSEKSSLAPLAIHSGSAESLRSDFGFRAFYQWQIGKIVVEPSLKAAWEHEYKYSDLPITAGFAGIPGPSDTFYGPSEGHDSAIVSAGVSVQWTPMIATYVNYDGQLGRSRYDSNAVTGGVRISF